MKILAFSGSLRKGSYNTALIRAIAEVAPSDVEITTADSSALPLFSEDLEQSFPSAATALKQQVEAADAIIIATPEYNRSIPGVLKNAIDWVSRPWGQNSFAGKPVLIMGVTIGSTGTAIAQSHLKQVMLFLDTKVVGQPELMYNASQAFDADGHTTEATKKSLTLGLDALMKLAQKEVPSAYVEMSVTQ